ncbi:MAG: aminotransferase class V-fold PLP-dependent enzyme [Gemmatimonadota bacterium]
MLTCRRADFTLPEGLHYLNCAYMSPLSRRVEEAGVTGMARKRDPAGIRSDDFFRDCDALRALFARLVHAPDSQRVAIVPSVSYGIGVVARNETARTGQNIVVSAEQFPSNVYPWRVLCAERCLELRTVAAPEVGEGRGEEWNARLLEAIDGDTAIVALPHHHWTDGTRFDLQAIGTRARDVGAALVIDGTQTLGAAPFDVAAIRPDALVCAAYKWLLGPYSIGLAYYGPRYDGGRPLEEAWLAKPASEDFRRIAEYRDDYRPAALRYDVGERSDFIRVPMLIAAIGQLLEWGIASIRNYCARLVHEMVEGVRDLDVWVEEAVWRAPHLFGLRLPPGVDLGRLQSAFAARRVYVSLRASAVRISPNVYNDPRDGEALCDALRDALD